MREEILKIISVYDKQEKHNYYFDSCTEIRDYVYKKINNLIFGRQNAKKIIDNLDLLIAYTNSSNCDWLFYESIYNNPFFISKLASSLKYYKYPECISELFSQLLSVIDKNKLFSNEMIDAISDIKELDQVVEILGLMDVNNRIKYYERCIANNKTICIPGSTLTDTELDFIEKNMDFFLNKCNNLIKLKTAFRTRKEKKDLICKYLDSNIDKKIESILNNCRYINKNNKMKEFIYYIVKEIIENENVDASKIEINTSGGYSEVVILGDKVLKIGSSRKTKEFPNNPYIIKPLLRQEVTIDDTTIFVEVTERVIVNREEVTDEILYSLYKELRNLGLVWTDIAAKNVGRLIKDNDIHWKEQIEPSDETLGLKKFKGVKKLKRGDFVILDADYIYEEGDKDISYPTRDICEEFEFRYQSEKNGITTIERDNNNSIKLT